MDLSSLQGKTVEIIGLSYAASSGVPYKGVITNLISGHKDVFLELDSKKLINIRHIRSIEILD